MIQKIREWDGSEYEVTVNADDFGNAVLTYPDGLTHVVAWETFESMVATAERSEPEKTL